MSNRLLGTMARIDGARVTGLLENEDDQAILLDEAEALAVAMGAQRFVTRIRDMRGETRQAATSGSA